MPPSDLDGFYLAQKCAASWPDIRIIIASGQIEQKAEDLPEGAIFVRMPFSADAVHDHLLQLLPDGKSPNRSNGVRLH